MKRLGLIVVVLMVLVAVPTRATAECRPDDYAFPARVLGPGWTETQPAQWWQEPRLELDFSSIDEIKARAYAGPGGAVVSTIVLVPNDTPADRAAALLPAGAIAQFAALQIGIFDVDDLSSNASAAGGPPECQTFITSAVKADAFGLPAAISQCRLDTGVNPMLISLVRGEVGRLDGAAASKVLIQAMLATAIVRGCD